MNRALYILICAVILCVCAGSLYYNQDNRDELSNKAYGNVDIRDSTLTFDKEGRIIKLLADEGDIVKEGQILALLDTKALEHQIEIQNGECSFYQAKYSELMHGYRDEEIQMAKASVETLENSLHLAKITYERYQSLYNRKSISAQERDNAYYTMQETAASLDNAKSKLAMVQQGYRNEQIEAAKANLERCRSTLDYLNYQKTTQSVLRAPYEGQIRTRLKEPGDMTTLSAGVFELSQINYKRVRCYLTERQLSVAKLGNSAIVSTSSGGRITGRIAYISSTAMFTPKTVQTEELRADLVYEVRIDVEDLHDTLRQGQPVTVEFQ